MIEDLLLVGIYRSYEIAFRITMTSVAARAFAVLFTSSIWPYWRVTCQIRSKKTSAPAATLIVIESAERFVPAAAWDCWNVMVTFVSVPQGSAWTGTIQLVSNLDPFVLASASWALMKNGQPYAAWDGYGLVYDVQATGGDVMSIRGTGIGPDPLEVLVTAQWIGRSDAQEDAPLVWPKVAGTPANVVISAASPGLPVVQNGLAEQSFAVSVLGAGANASITMVSPGATTQLRLWEIGLSAYCGGAASGQFQVHVQDTSGGSIDYCTVMAFNAANAEGCNSQRMSLWGLTLPAGVGVKLVTSNSTATITGASCNLLYTIAGT